MKSGGLYGKKQIFKYLFLFVLMAVAMKVSGGAGFAVIFPFALWALCKKRSEDLFYYMLLTITAVVGNPNLMPKNGIAFAVEQRGMMALFGLLLAMRVAGQKKSRIIAPLMGILVYIAYMAVPSFLGWCVPVSFMKIALFLLVFLAYFGSANALAISNRDNLPAMRAMMLAMAIIFIWGSVALIPYPAYGLMRSRFAVAGHPETEFTSFFMGMTSHSQCLGPVISGFAVMLLSDWLFNVRKFSWLYFGLLICCPILIWRTASRTALMTFSIGMMVVVYFFLQARHVGNQWKGKVFMGLLLFAILGGIAVLVNPKSRESLQRFLVKHNIDENYRVEVTVDNLTSSRMGLVDTAMDNFKKSPLIGNGFQVSWEMDGMKIHSFKELISAPIEKGVWVVAILEEGGVIGFLIFVCFAISIFVKAIKRGAYLLFSVFFVFLLSNMGEFSFFSMSYLGGFMWALVFMAAALDAARIRALSYPQRYESIPQKFPKEYY